MPFTTPVSEIDGFRSDPEGPDQVVILFPDPSIVGALVDMVVVVETTPAGELEVVFATGTLVTETEIHAAIISTEPLKIFAFEHD